jgi:hypothetical protein
MASLSPCDYAVNNPLSYTDPSGWEPEHETREPVSPMPYLIEGVHPYDDWGRDNFSGCAYDPDVIVLGEIRDSETAQMAIRAALTGHLVLSTVHTNSAWGKVSRLIDMDVPSFLLASTLNLSVAQRLIPPSLSGLRAKKTIWA